MSAFCRNVGSGGSPRQPRRGAGRVQEHVFRGSRTNWGVLRELSQLGFGDDQAANAFGRFMNKLANSLAGVPVPFADDRYDEQPSVEG